MQRLLLAALAATLLSGCGSSPAPTRPAVPAFRHVVVIVFENKERPEIFGSNDAPTFNALGRRYAKLVGYRGVTHPSLPNYIALVSGSTQGITENCTDCVVDARNLADTLVAAKKTWKTYAEGLPEPGWTGGLKRRYAKKHNPFLYFRSVVSKPAQRNRVVPLAELRADLDAGRLPDFALIVPDLCSSMHDCSVATGDKWLGRVAKPLLDSPELARSVIFVVFDEGDSDIGGGGEIAALALGPAVRPGSTYASLVSHYGLLRTIEDGWGLPKLGASAREQPITGIWR
jgi:phospholipase C